MSELIWQDAVLMIGNIFFLIALVPSVLGENKPSKWTSLITATTLTTFAVVYFTLSLSYATIATTLSALAWRVLCIQKW